MTIIEITFMNMNKYHFVIFYILLYFIDRTMPWIL